MIERESRLYLPKPRFQCNFDYVLIQYTHGRRKYNNFLIMKDDLQLGKLKENCLLLKLLSQTQKNVSEPQTLPSCKSSFTHVYSLIRYTDTSRLLFSSTCVALTNRYISWPSLCHLSPGSSMVRASHRRSEGCGFDSRLGLRNIFLSLR